MTDLATLNLAPDLPDEANAYLLDDAHTYEERRLDPGVYASTARGHALLVGTNQRSLTVVDLGGVIQVAGIDVTDPDHLAALADHLRRVADRLRDRQSATGGGAVPVRQIPVAQAPERKCLASASRVNTTGPDAGRRRTSRRSIPSRIEVVDLLSLIEDQP